MAKIKLTVADCCASCKRSMFEVTGDGLKYWGKCYDTRKVKSVKIDNLCRKYARRNDIFSADKLSTNSVANPVKGLKMDLRSIHDAD